MTYTVISENYENQIFIDKNNEGAFRLTALVHDLNDTFNLDLGPFYKTCTFYGYEVNEAIAEYIHYVLNEMNYVFVEEDD